MDELRRVWLYNFKLHVSALEVYFISEFNDWSNSHKMVQVSEGYFEKEVVLPDRDKILYAFDVDGVWMIDPSSMQEVNHFGHRCNVLVTQHALPTESLRIPPESSAYQYKRLDFDTHEIRILNLNLSRSQGRIYGSIEHVSLIKPGSYNALSYCWGDSRKNEVIVLDGVAVPITESLYFALRNVIDLATREAHSGPLKLWVDALCINQADTQERSSQVRIMRQIYSRASRVIAAVGEPERLLYDWRGHYTPESVAYLIKSRFIGRITEHDEDQLTYSWELNGWSILETFFNEPYWTRVWVIQELTVAINVVMLCANVEIKWEDVAAILLLWKNSTELFSGSKSYRRAFHLLEFRERFSVTREPIRLLDALRWSHSTRSTDPRDKIFGLLGLCYDWQNYVPLPNYKQPLEVVMADMAKSMMRLNRSLDLICFTGPNSREMNIGPTWLPNFFHLGNESITLIDQRIFDHHILCDCNPILEELENSQLAVRSIQYHHTINRVSSAMRPYDKEDIPTPYKRDWISETLQLTTQDPRLLNCTGGEKILRDSIWGALTMAIAPQTLSKDIARNCFSILWTPNGRGAIHNLDLIRWIDDNAWLQIGPWTLREWSRLGYLPKSVTGEISSADFATFVESMENSLRGGMRLCETSDDEGLYFVALAPPDSGESDQIHYIQGCSVPVILRKEIALDGTAGYRVIGGAYLPNVKDYFMEFMRGGEAPRGFEASRIVLI